MLNLARTQIEPGRTRPNPDKDFEEMTLPWRRELYAAALRLSGSRADAQDLVQETYLRALTHFDQFSTGTNCRAWMHRILTNSFINRHRRRVRERAAVDRSRRGEIVAPLLVDPQAGKLARSNAAEEASLHDEVAAAIASLPFAHRTVLMLVAVEELSYREAAARIGCPIGTIMSRLHRARRAIEGRLRPFAVEEGYLPDCRRVREMAAEVEEQPMRSAA